MKSKTNHIFDIRPATKNDSAVIYGFIRELAEYENLLHEVQSTASDIHEALFGERACAEAILVYDQDVPVGFALYFTTFSTFVGRPGIYLEDLYVKPECRGKGFGKALLIRLAKIAKERSNGRLEWAVLNWNEPAIRFYKGLGAKPMDEWTIYRMTGDCLDNLAENGE